MGAVLLMTEDVADVPDRKNFSDYARALRRRWRLVLVVLVAAVALALAYSLAATPQYVSTADVLIEPSGTELATDIAAEEVATQTQVVTSLPVARLVQTQLSLDKTPDLTKLVTVQALNTSRILRVTAEDTSPDRAADTANTVATAYLQFRQQESISRYERARDRLTQEETEVDRRLKEIDRLLAKDGSGKAELQAERRNVLTKLGQIATQMESLTDQLTSVGSGGELLRSAEADHDPVSPQTLLNVILGALFGLLLGLGAAILRDRFDDAVHGEESVRQAVGAVVVGRVPAWPERAYRDDLVTVENPHAPASEEYQRLAVNVRFMAATARAADTHGAVVLTTSGQEGEGKTITSCNLAVAAARLGLRVVMVDGDLRRGAVSARFGLDDPPGLSDLLVSEDKASSYLIDVGVDNLDVLAAGTAPPNPAALLSSGRMRLVLSELAAEADLVILDSPPVLTGADSLELATLADVVIVVTRDRVSRRRQLVAVRETLRHLKVGAVGIVCNALGDSPRAAYAHDVRGRATREPVEKAEESAVVDPAVSSAGSERSTEGSGSAAPRSPGARGRRQPRR